MSDIFYDRRGHEKYADEIIPLHQKGYFAILVKDEKVLVTYPPQVSVPEFPGGPVSVSRCANRTALPSRS